MALRMARAVVGTRRTPAGQRHIRVSLFRPEQTPDGDGGVVETLVPLTPPDAWISMTTATAQNLERLGAGTVIAAATYFVVMEYRTDVNSKTRMTYGARTFNVLSVQNPDERNRALELVVSEVLP